MEMMLSILRGAYCRSTHHYLALDALRQVTTHRGKRLRDLLLRYHTEYLQGSKDPDTRFRDFHNHVIHVSDNLWGGADEAAEQWRQRFLGLLRDEKWPEAAHALGVMSHYFMDPFQPLHTAQTPHEAVVHRPMEWSICCAYEELYALSQNPDLSVSFTLGTEPDWLQQAIFKGASLAHRYYHPLVDDYDMSCCTKSPPNALSAKSRELLAEIIAVVLTGWARVVERMAEEAAVEIPEQSLTIPALIAGIKMPAAWITRRIASTTERKAIAELFDEYKLTGSLHEHLPDEVRQVRQTRKADANAELGVKPSPPASTTPVATAPTSVPTSTVEEPATAHDETASDDDQPTIHRMPVPRLTLESPLVHAPSIGPKTAQRFAQIAVHTVGNFLQNSAADLSQRLRTKWITVDVVLDWQNQCRLACSVAGLKSQTIQILVGVGILNAEQLAQSHPKRLFAEVLKYCDTSAGRRILRGSELPTEADVASWISAGAGKPIRSQNDSAMLQSAS